MRARRDAVGVILGDHVEGFCATKLPSQFAPGGANFASAIGVKDILRSSRRADEDCAVDAVRHAQPMLFEKLVEARQVLRRRRTSHVVKRQHRVGFAATEIGLKFNDWIAAAAGQPLGCTDQQCAEAFRQIRAAKKLPRIAIFRRGAARMDFGKVGSEFRLLELARGDVLVRLDDFAPWEQT